MEQGQRSLAERLRWARERAFVGRDSELSLFRRALGGAPGAPAVIYVHGPGGVGKSTLLRRFADESRDAGRVVIEINGRLAEPSPAGFEAQVAPARDVADPVLIVDAFEHCQGLEGWFSERFLPSMPSGSLVVLAGREAPSPVWVSDVAWSEMLAVRRLGDLTPQEVRDLLRLRGLPPAVCDRIEAFAGGNPLALNLAASVAAAVGGDVWEPTPDVLAALLGQLVGDVPGPVHRLALEVAAHAMTTTEGLLRAVVGADDAAAMFTWLRRLPVADWGPQGLYLHDLVSDAIDADLRWRDPDGYAEMHRRVGHWLLEQVRTAPDAEALVAIRELSYLKRYGPMGEYFQMRREGDFHEDVMRAGDRDAIRAMIATVEGPQAAAAVEHWFGRHPEAFWMYRDARTGEPAAFLLSLRLTALPEEDASADPVAAAAWRCAQEVAPLRQGEHVRLARMLIYPPAYGELSPVLHLMHMRICAEWIRTPGLAWSFAISPDPDRFEPLMAHLGHRRRVTLPPADGRTQALFACDWRTTPLSIWFDRTQPGSLTEERPTGPADAVLTRSAFDAAVREALREWHRPDALAANPLAGARIVRAAAEPAARIEALREAITDAVDALLEDPRDSRLHAVLAMTFFHRLPSQAVAAERLGLPFSTYRRHLDRAQQRVCELLWRQESEVRTAPQHS
ncbi:ATP-binding protein [Sphaerisporangium sp. B11E5]|uniref:ATP-binding protein n=1 Tax=Sphaerisporangium sp. B11E5 TaxID=3153563 RepID=UPI00325CEFA2